MKIKVGDKLPSSELFYLDQNNDVKKINILEFCKINKTLILVDTLNNIKIDSSNFDLINIGSGEIICKSNYKEIIFHKPLNVNYPFI